MVWRDAVAPHAPAFSGYQPLSGACPPHASGYCNGESAFPSGELFLGCSAGIGGHGGPTWLNGGVQWRALPFPKGP